MGRIVKGCVREVSLAQVSCILMYVYVCSVHTSGCVVDGLGATAAFRFVFCKASLGGHVLKLQVV